MPRKRKPRNIGQERLDRVVTKNIQTLAEVRKELERRSNAQDRAADGITAFSGSMWFVYFHAFWFGAWIFINAGWVDIPPFDPYPYGLLTMVVSLEAIFLSTFVLISQNRISKMADSRADLDLHVNLLAEHELTRALKLLDAIADHLELPAGNDPELRQLEHDIRPQDILKELQYRNGR